MEDIEIIELYFSRDESAIGEMEKKYGKLCRRIAMNILRNELDAEECVNDTYLETWNSIPPHRPRVLSAFLGSITRRRSVSRLRSRTALRRGGGVADEALEELGECVGTMSAEEEFDRLALSRVLEGFVRSLEETERYVFLRRYWYAEPITDISESLGFTESKVKSMLFRTRKKLAHELEKEGFI